MRLILTRVEIPRIIIMADSAPDNCPPLSMFYVYILKTSKGGQLYIGYTNDLRRRLREHMRGGSEYTKHRQPTNLVYYEAYSSEKDARGREKVLKQFKGTYGHLKKRIRRSIETT